MVFYSLNKQTKHVIWLSLLAKSVDGNSFQIQTQSAVKFGCLFIDNMLITMQDKGNQERALLAVCTSSS